MNAKNYIFILPVLVGAFISIIVGSADATLIPLEPLTEGGEYDEISGLNLYAVIVDNGSQVGIEVHNDSTINSSIAEIYFEEGVLDGIVGLESEGEVLFREVANPATLPSANEIVPSFTAAYSVEALPPSPHNGINPGESLTVKFGLDEGITYHDLCRQMENGSLRIGLHVTALPNDLSLPMVSSAPVPEPTTLALLSMGCLFFVRKRKG